MVLSVPGQSRSDDIHPLIKEPIRVKNSERPPGDGGLLKISETEIEKGPD